MRWWRWRRWSCNAPTHEAEPAPLPPHPAAAYTLAMARFLKMHGCGNDFVVFDERAGAARPDRRAARPRSPTGAPASAATSSSSSSRHRTAPTPTPSCASATPTAPRPAPAATPPAASPRCWRARPAAARQVIRTVAGDLPAEVLPDGRVRVDMGPARLDWPDIPLARPMDTLHLDLARGPVRRSGRGQHGQPARDVLRRRRRRACRWRSSGPRLEHDPLFPERANIGFAQVLAPDRIRLRVWERGAGLTLRLRLRRLRGAGERAPARPDRAARHRRGGRRRAGDRMARRTATC